MRRKLFKFGLILLLAAGIGGSGFLGYKNKKLADERDGLQQEIASANRKIRLMKKKHAEEKARNSSLMRAKMQVEDQLRAVKSDLQKLEAEKARLVSEQDTLGKKQVAKIARLEKQISRYKEKHTSLKEERQALRGNLAKYKETVAARDKTIRSMEADHGTTRTALRMTTRKFERCSGHNERLCKLAAELVDKYKTKPAFRGLAEKEPFTQMKKVELEHFIQEYLEKIDQEQMTRDQG